MLVVVPVRGWDDLTCGAAPLPAGWVEREDGGEPQDATEGSLGDLDVVCCPVHPMAKFGSEVGQPCF